MFYLFFFCFNFIFYAVRKSSSIIQRIDIKERRVLYINGTLELLPVQLSCDIYYIFTGDRTSFSSSIDAARRPLLPRLYKDPLFAFHFCSALIFFFLQYIVRIYILVYTEDRTAYMYYHLSQDFLLFRSLVYFLRCFCTPLISAG